MKVKLLTSRAGVNFSQNYGDVVDLDNGEAMQLIKSGSAVAVESSKVERATKNKVKEKRA